MIIQQDQPIEAQADASISPLTTMSIARSCVSWMTTWRAWEPVPDHIGHQLPAAISEMEAACSPADPRAVAVAIKSLWNWIKAFDVLPAPEIVDLVNEHYWDALSALPTDLALLAVKRVIGNHRWAGRPKPAELTHAVSAEWFERKDALMRLQTARRVWERSNPPEIAP